MGVLLGLEARAAEALEQRDQQRLLGGGVGDVRAAFTGVSSPDFGPFATRPSSAVAIAAACSMAGARMRTNSSGWAASTSRRGVVARAGGR